MKNNFLPKTDAKKSFNDNFIFIRKQITNFIGKKIENIIEKDFNVISYLNNSIKEFGLDYSFEKVEFNNPELILSIKNIVKKETKKVVDINDIVFFYCKLGQEYFPNYNGQKIINFFIKGLELKDYKSLSGKAQIYYKYINASNTSTGEKILYRHSSFVEIMYYFETFNYILDFSKEMGKPLSKNELLEGQTGYSIFMKTTIENKWKGNQVWSEKQTKGVFSILPPTNELLGYYIKSGIGDPHSDNSVHNKVSGSEERKENSKVYQKTNLKGNDNTEVIMKDSVLGLIENQEIKNIINAFQGFEIDKDTDIKNLHKFFSGYIKLLSIIQESIKEVSIYSTLLPNVFFKVRKLGQHKAAGLFYPANNVMAVDVNHWNSIIHETGHMVHFNIAKVKKNKQVEEIFSQDKFIEGINNLGMKELYKFLKLYKNITTICKTPRKGKAIRISKIKLEEQNKQKNIGLDSNIIIDQTIKNSKDGYYKKIIKTPTKMLEYSVKEDELDNQYYLVNETNIFRDEGFRKGYSLLMNTLGIPDMNYDKFLEMKEIYNKELGGLSGKYSVSSYVINGPELFARIFDYFFRYNIEKGKLKEEEKKFLLSEAMLQGKDGGIERFDYYLLNNFIKKDILFNDFSRLLNEITK